MDTEPTQKDTVPPTDEKLLPVPAQTVRRDASWGAVISIIIILAMIVIGAFYAWGKRISEEQGLGAAVIQSVSTTTAATSATKASVK